MGILLGPIPANNDSMVISFSVVDNGSQGTLSTFWRDFFVTAAKPTEGKYNMNTSTYHREPD